MNKLRNTALTCGWLNLKGPEAKQGPRLETNTLAQLNEVKFGSQKDGGNFYCSIEKA